MIQLFLHPLASYRLLQQKSHILEYELQIARKINDELKEKIEKKEKELQERSKLTLQDLELSAVDSVSLSNLDEFQRLAMFHACEIIRLCNYDENLRDATVQVRDLLMDATKNEKFNLLPHEKKESMTAIQKKMAEVSKKLPALPRYDSQYA